MNELNCFFNGEYAVKYISPLKSHKSEVELFSCLNWNMVNTDDMPVESLVDIVSEVWASWRRVSEDEFNEIVKSYSK